VTPRKAALALLLAVAVAATLVTTAGSAGARPNALPTRTPGTLTVAVDIGTPGLAEGNDVKGKVAGAKGFEIDLARALARKLGLRLRIVDVPFAHVIGPGAKQFDVSIAHVTITRKRAKSVDFSPPYLVVNKGVMVAPGVTPPTTLSALRKLQICAQTSTTSLAYVRTTLKPTHPPHTFVSLIDELIAVGDGYCQAMVADLEILVGAKREQPDLYGPIAGQIVTHEHYGAVFQKGSKLRGPVSSALIALAHGGVITQLENRSFGKGWNDVRVLK
jgi:ABC-type amino acid transport substrate-binding protein